MTDIRTILVTEAQIADITSDMRFMVTDGPSQKTFQTFPANTSGNAQINFNLQIPSQEIITSRCPVLSTELQLTITITGAAAGVTGSALFQYGLTDAFQSFPLNSLFNVSSAQINNTTVSSNIRQIKDLLLRFYDMRKLGSYQSTTPSKIDSAYANFADAVGANNNPLADYSTGSIDEDFVARGAFPLDNLQVVYVPATGAGAGVGVVVEYGTAITSRGVGDVWYIYLTAALVEPILGLSPFSSIEPFESNKAGFYGINTMNLNFTVDNTCSRVWSTANPYISNIQLGYVNVPAAVTGTVVANPNGFNNTSIQVEFLSPTPAQVAKMSSSKTVLPYYDYPYFSSNFNGNTTFTAGQTGTITLPNVQLSSIPDYLVIAARIPMSAQNWENSASFLTINSVSINFNNASGLLSSASANQLFELSKKNGYNGNWYEWQGKATNLYTPASGVATTGGNVRTISTTGSVLVISPSDLSLPMWASGSSLGQYNLLITLNVTNNYGFTTAVEGIVLTPQSGIFETNQGTSAAFTGILTKESVLRAKEQERSVVSTSEYRRLIGGRGLSHAGATGLHQRLMHRIRQHGEAMSSMGGNMGGSQSGGKMHSRNRLAC